MILVGYKRDLPGKEKTLKHAEFNTKLDGKHKQCLKHPKKKPRLLCIDSKLATQVKCYT